MRKLRVAFLLSVMVLSMFAFTGFITPVQAEAGLHQITAVYTSAYIYNDQDTTGAGEWYFRLYAAGAWTPDGPEYERDDPGPVDFTDVTKSWSISGGSGTSFKCQARERDLGYWDPWATSTITHNIGWPWPGTVNAWHYGNKISGDVKHYFKYYIRNLAPTVGSISGPSSGSTGVAYTYTTTGSDPEGDSITYQWSVNGVIQPATGPSLTYTFPSSGTYTVRVRTRDYFSAYSSYASKTVTIAMPSITIVRVDAGALYLPGTLIRILAWIKENGSPMTTGTVTAKIYAKGVSGKGDVLLDTLVMTLVDPTIGKWRVFSYPIPVPSDPEGFQGTYVVKVTAEHPPATPATRSATCFVADRLLQGGTHGSYFVTAASPSRVVVNQNFEANAVIENPSGATQTFTVRLVLPSGMTRVGGDPLERTVTLTSGARTTLRWTLKSTTATNKLVKIDVLSAPGGSIAAKLYWYVRDPADTT